MESEERTSKPGTHTLGTCLSETPCEPSAKPGCSECLSISVARENARSTFDYSAVSDANVRMRQHHAASHAS
ncbi:hypothetical protein GCM10010381_59750 [Streptomyces xantholiticus]|nr:hypothetical protein GCM10010381_59750 [Streptomyces xantholiticus]